MGRASAGRDDNDNDNDDDCLEGLKVWVGPAQVAIMIMMMLTLMGIGIVVMVVEAVMVVVVASEIRRQTVSARRSLGSEVVVAYRNSDARRSRQEDHWKRTPSHR